MGQKYYRVKMEIAHNGRSNRATDKRIYDLKLGALIDCVSTIVEWISSTVEVGQNLFVSHSSCYYYAFLFM